MSSCGNDRRNHTQPRRVNPTRADEIISFCSATQLFYRLNRDIPQQPEQAICTVFVCRHFFAILTRNNGIVFKVYLAAVVQSSVHSRILPQLFRKRSTAFVRQHPPLPVSGSNARSVDPPFRRKPENILHLRDKDSGRRTHASANHTPVDALGGIQRKILFCKSAFGLRGLCEPLHNRCIVVRTGIIYPVSATLCGR